MGLRQAWLEVAAMERHKLVVLGYWDTVADFHSREVVRFERVVIEIHRNIEGCQAILVVVIMMLLPVLIVLVQSGFVRATY